MHWQESTRLWIILPAVLRRLCTCLGGARRRWVRQCFNLKNKIGLENLFYRSASKRIVIFLAAGMLRENFWTGGGVWSRPTMSPSWSVFLWSIIFLTSHQTGQDLLHFKCSSNPTANKTVGQQSILVLFCQFGNNCCWEMESLEHSTPHGLTFIICSWCSSFELKS